MRPGIDLDPRAERFVELLEGRFRYAFEQSVIGMALVDLDGRYVRVNRALCELLDRSPAELVGTRWQDITHPDDVPEGESFADRAIARADQVLRRERRYLRADGRPVWTLVNVSLVTDDNGAPACFFSQIVDITDQKMAQEMLGEAERRHRALIERIPGIVYTAEAGRSGRWLYVSPHLETMLGYEPEEWVNDPQAWFRAVHPEDKERVAEEETAGVSLGPGFSAVGEYRLVSRDGHSVWVRDEAAVIQERPGGPPLWQGVIVDITHTKLLEERVRHSDKMEAVGVLAGGAAHNFNNLLAVITNYAGFVMEDLQEGDPCRADMEEIVAAARRASKLVRELVAFSQEDDQPEGAIVDLNEVIAGMESLLRTTLEGTVFLQTNLQATLPSTKADAGQIEQMLLNLVLNARDAMPDGGEMTITTEFVEVDESQAARHRGFHPGRYVCFGVIDDGCGMTEEVCSRMFDPFYTTKGKTAGTGLGLASVYGIVKKWQGYVAVDTEVDRGTTVKVYLPAEPG